MTNVLLTGSTGFVGTAVQKVLLTKENYILASSVRILPSKSNASMRYVEVDGLHDGTDWNQAVFNIDIVIHCAARVHVLNEKSLDPLAEFRKVNVQGTLNLARQAVTAGVKRFIFISSIKVNGEETSLGRPYHADDVPNPTDPYGISKLEAEQGLLALAKETGLEVVIIRPVLVYGPGVKANFQSMIKWLYRGVPLPLGAINNKRSLVALDNLVDLITVCIEHPAAINQVFLVSDDDDLGTTELFRKTSMALGRKAKLLQIPSVLLVLFAKILGKSAFSKRLCGSLQVDITKTKNLLGWHPPKTVEESLQKAVDYFLSQNL